MTKTAATPKTALVNHWEDDVLQRKSVADDFTQILKTLPTPQVVGINASYGMGKTFFMERWGKDLKQSGHTVLFFNAWENDFSNDPLMAFVVDLQEQVAALGVKKANSAVQGVLESAGRIGLQAMKSAAEAVALGLVDLEAINQAEKDSDFKDAYGDFAQDKVRSHLDVRAGVAGFKEGLSGIVSALKAKSGPDALPIIVMIDELDRCRPDFAVQLLENIKHVFSVRDFVFVLGMDRSQMRHAVGVIYGHGMDGEGYLRRFIDLELELPEPKTKLFVQYLLARSELKNFFSDQNYHRHIMYDPECFADTFAEYADFFGLTLREQYQVFQEAVIAIRRIGKKGYYPLLMGFLAPLKAKHKHIYRLIGTTLTDPWEIIEAVEAAVGKRGYHVRVYDKNKTHSTLEFLAATFATELGGVVYKEQRAIEQKNELSRAGKSIPRDLERDASLYSQAVAFARVLDRNFHAFDNRTPVILYVKELLDIGAAYTK